jgi:hypothetical protein
MKTVAVVPTSTTPPGYWKSILLDIFAVGLAALFGWTFSRYLAGGISFWFVGTALLLWGSASVIEGFLQLDIPRRFLIIFLESIALVIFFYAYAWQALAIAVIIVLVCLLWGYFSVRRELRNTIELRFFTASGKVLGKVITAAVVFMIIMYASLASGNGNFFVSQNGFDALFSWGAQFVNNFYPTVPLTGSFGDFAQAVARMQLQGNPQFQSLTPAEQSEALSDSASQVVGAFTGGNASGTVATSPAASEPTSNVFYSYLSNIFVNLQNRFGAGFVGVWGLALFLILRSVGIIVVWVAQFVALLFYELLLATGFMKITEQTATKEKIGY